MILFPILALVAVIILVLSIVGPRRYERLMSIVAFVGVGAFLGLTPLEFGIVGLFLSAAMLVVLLVSPSTRPIRMERVGGYLVGAGGAGVILLLSLVVRIKNVCGSAGVFGIGGSVSGSASGTGSSGYECYSAETLTGVVMYAALACLGVIILVFGRRAGGRPSWVQPRPRSWRRSLTRLSLPVQEGRLGVSQAMGIPGQSNPTSGLSRAGYLVDRDVLVALGGEGLSSPASPAFA